MTNAHHIEPRLSPSIMTRDDTRVVCDDIIACITFIRDNDARAMICDNINAQRALCDIDALMTKLRAHINA